MANSFDYPLYLTRHLKTFLNRFNRHRLKIHIPQCRKLRMRLKRMHFHFTPEVFLQLHGSTKFRGPDYHFTLHSSELAILPRGVPHGEIAVDGKSKPFEGIVCGFAQRELHFYKSFKNNHGIPKVEQGLSIPSHLSTKVASYVDDISTLFPRKLDTYQKIQFNSLMQITFSHFLEILKEKASPPPTSARIFQCKNLISSQLTSPTLSVQSLAQELQCSPDHLTRIFKSETGYPISLYIRNERLNHAISLMNDVRLNLSDIAHQSGFSSLNYFSRLFHQSLGISPSEYRRSRQSIF